MQRVSPSLAGAFCHLSERCLPYDHSLTCQPFADQNPLLSRRPVTTTTMKIPPKLDPILSILHPQKSPASLTTTLVTHSHRICRAPIIFEPIGHMQVAGRLLFYYKHASARPKWRQTYGTVRLTVEHQPYKPLGARGRLCAAWHPALSWMHPNSRARCREFHFGDSRTAKAD